MPTLTFPYIPNGLPPALTAEAMRAADRATIETYGLPGFTLMESAGRAAVDEIERVYGSMRGKTVAVFCGKGNNGGDGFVVARRLLAQGAGVHVCTLSDPADLRDDAAHNYRLLENLVRQDPAGRLRLGRFEGVAGLTAYGACDLFVDALLGTGLTSALRSPILELVLWLNAQPQPTVALDLPTGLHADTGTVLGAAVEAGLTVTMGALKTGIVLGEGPRVSGRVVVVEIGIPGFLLEAAGDGAGCARYTTDAGVGRWRPTRAHDAHKYSVGLTLVVAGAPGLTGAPVMASTAAARVGSGYVVCACPAPIQPVLAQKMTEVTTVSLPVTDDGGLVPDAAWASLAPRLKQAKALLIGPGLGRHPQTAAFVRMLLERTTLPVVLDADGLHALVGHEDLLARHAAGRWILTPHGGEFKRLAGAEVALENRVRTAQAYAQRWNSVLLLKGLPSVVGCPDGRAYINGTGNPALATAGTGDVLAGLCAGLLAQGLTPEQAAVLGVHLGGAAADRYALHYGGASLMATDLLQQLPLVLKERF